jgi:diguanylate cyclase (GGDEF)-like protein
MAIAVAAACSLVCLLLLWRLLMAQFRKLETVQAVLRKKSVLLETTLTNMDQGLIMVTADRTVGVFNQRALRLLDLPAGLMHEGVRIDDLPVIAGDQGGLADPGGDMPAPPDPCGFVDDPLATERSGPNGTVLEVRSVPLSDGGMVRTYTDITRRKLAEKHVIHASRHDVLTGLPNRAMFSQRLQAAISDAASAGSGLAVLFLDLDRFKLVNDTLGHAAGDDLLQQVAGRMRTAVRETDTLARIGGDEFALVMPGKVRPETAIATAERLRSAVRAPCLLAQGTASVGVSIGIACFPADGTSTTDLLNHADLALYRAKATGRDMVCVFDATLDTGKHGELMLESSLAVALQEEQFALAYQPIQDIRTDRIVGAEALIRWHHPARGIIPPASFIPLAERTGLIVDLGRWVMATACREALSWASPISVSVNVAPAQLRRVEIVDELRELLASTGLPPSRLVIEVTEGQLLEETRQMGITLSALRDLGVRLALDDFGTGFSSLSTLRSFPFSDLKIDRTFTQTVLQDDRSRALIEAILQVCRVLNLDCVAEGIETPEQLALLKDLGCTHAQGYLIGRPEPPATIRRALWRASGEGRPRAGRPLEPIPLVGLR